MDSNVLIVSFLISFSWNYVEKMRRKRITENDVMLCSNSIMDSSGLEQRRIADINDVISFLSLISSLTEYY